MKTYKDRTITKAVLAVTRDNATLKSIEDNCEKHKGLIVEDIKCKDCGKEFKWYKSTLRCSPCQTIYRRKWYLKKDNYLETPMVIINSKGLVIGEANRPLEIREWFLKNTEIKKHKLKGITGIRYALNRDVITKFICYWIMYKKDYTFEKSVEYINKRSILLGVKKEIIRDKETFEKVIAIFNETGLQKDIAIKYKLSRPMVNKIKTGEKYSDITGKEYKRTYNIDRV